MKRKRVKKAKKNKNKKWWVLLLAFGVIVCICSHLQKEGGKGWRFDFSSIFQEQEKLEKEKNRPFSKTVLYSKIDKSEDQKKIKVILTDSAMQTMFHSQIVLTGTEPYYVSSGEEKKSYPAGEKQTFLASDFLEKEKEIKISCPSGKIAVLSIKRRGCFPKYDGEMKIIFRDGGLVLINQVTLEQYLCGVLPGEMSVNYPLEALKAQAVCARTYAWKQLQEKRYRSYGADLDDTTAFQVYQMAEADRKIKKAVAQTAGQKLYHAGKLITAYYYSTSWGCSATPPEIWGGAENKVYLRKIQNETKDGITRVDFSSEENFKNLLSQKKMNDQSSSMFRWKVRFSAETLGNQLGIGRIDRILIAKREKCGVISKVEIQGKEGNCELEGQQEIREKLMVPGTEIEKNDGTKCQLSMLPSGAFYIENDALAEGGELCVVGGGFGHGVGMSQCGALAQAKKGKKYVEILKYYYNQIKIY